MPTLKKPSFFKKKKNHSKETTESVQDWFKNYFEEFKEPVPAKDRPRRMDYPVAQEIHQLSK